MTYNDNLWQHGRAALTWAVPPMTRVYHAPLVPSWTSNDPIPEYQRRLAALGISDPTAATEHYALGQDRRAAFASAHSTSERIRLAAEAQASLEAAVSSIHQYTEAAWLALLRPIVATAIETTDDSTWLAAHDLGEWLRDRRLFGLARANNAARPWYMFDRVDLLLSWREPYGRVPLPLPRHVKVVRGILVARFTMYPRDPIPTLSQIADLHLTEPDQWPNWRPGLYDATQVVARSRQVATEQEQSIDEV